MQIKRKILKYPFLISIASAVILFIVALVGKVESYFKSGLTTFEQAHLGFEMLEMDPALCEWIENENSTVEANQYQKETISSSYLKAWKWLNASMENSDLRGMEDYFKEIPTSKILNNLRHTDGQISQADLQHHLILMLVK